MVAWLVAVTWWFASQDVWRRQNVCDQTPDASRRQQLV